MGENLIIEGDSETTLVAETCHNQDSTFSVKKGILGKEDAASDPKNISLDLSKEIRRLENILDKDIRASSKKETSLKRAVKILETYEKDQKTVELIDKWRAICQCGMSYLLNTIKSKIDRMGGYQEYKRKELEAKKRQLEYQYDDGIQQQMDEILESPDFFHLPIEEKNEVRDRMEEKIREAQEMKEKQLEVIEREFQQHSNDEMTMQELATKMKVDYELVYPLQY